MKTTSFYVLAMVLASPAFAQVPPPPPSNEQQNLLLQGDDGAASEGEITFEDPLVGYVVTTGSKRRQRSSDSLPSISILTRQEVDLLPYFYLGDLLGMMPGVDARWGMMQRYYIGVRGLGSTTALNSRLLLLWDGVPMNDPFTGELNAGPMVPLVDVDRIEVIRGAGSSMYGANAFSGVVNVVTRDPTELEPKEGARASALMGSFLTSRVQAAADEKLHGVHVGGSVEAFRTDGPFPSVERQTPNGIDIFKNDDVQSVATEAHVAYKGLQLRGQYTHGDRGRPGTFVTDSNGDVLPCSTCHSSTEWGKGQKYPATPDSCGNCHAAPRDREVQDRFAVAALYQRWLGRGFRFSTQAYDNEYRTRYKSMKEAQFLSMIEEDIDLAQRASGADLYLAHASSVNNAVLGGELRRTEAASQIIRTPTGDDAATLTNIASYLEDELTPTSWLALTGGARFDSSSLFGRSLSPRGGIVVKPAEHLSIRGSASQAFRNPSLDELYVYERRGKYNVTGNPMLQPEWITSFEGGINYAFPMRDRAIVRLSGAGFWNRTNDLISIHAITPEIATFYNFGDATVHGGEFDSELELKTRVRIRGLANFSYQHAEDARGHQLPYAPMTKANGTFMASEGHWSVLLRLRYVGDRMDEMQITLPAFATLDVSAQYDMGSGLLMQLWADNLNDDGTQESLGVPRAPRSLFVTLGYRLAQ